MDQFVRVIFSFTFLCAVFYQGYSQGLKINEVMSSNTMVVYDEDGDTPDWLEIINSSNTDVKLSDYYLSEDPENLLKWQLPDMILGPNQPLLIYASGKDRPQSPLYWHTIIDVGQSWKYLVPSSEPAVSWKTYNFSNPSLKS